MEIINMLNDESNKLNDALKKIEQDTDNEVKKFKINLLKGKLNVIEETKAYAKFLILSYMTDEELEKIRNNEIKLLEDTYRYFYNKTMHIQYKDDDLGINNVALFYDLNKMHEEIENIKNMNLEEYRKMVIGKIKNMEKVTPFIIGGSEAYKKLEKTLDEYFDAYLNANNDIERKELAEDIMFISEEDLKYYKNELLNMIEEKFLLAIESKNTVKK